MSLDLITVLPPYLAKNDAISRLLQKEWLKQTDLTSLSHCDLNFTLFTSRADAVLVVIDAVYGTDKRDHWIKALACLTGVPHIILAIDNISHVDDPRSVCESLRKEFEERAPNLACQNLHVVPVDFDRDVNLETGSTKLDWYADAPLVLLLENIAENPVSTSTDDHPTQNSDQFAIYMYWRDESPMLPSRHYIFDNGKQQAEANISMLKFRLNPQTLDQQAAKRLHAGDIGYGNMSLDIGIDTRANEEKRGADIFWLKDQKTGKKLAYGIIKHSLRRATNIRWQQLDINKQERAQIKQQKPFVLWFTGLSGSGKSTIASLIEKNLHAMGYHTYLMDGDNVRHGLCRDLGFTEVDRVENIRRIAETAKLMVDAGLITLTSFISPFSAERQMARDLFAKGEFLEVFVDTPLEICEQRDIKGLYKKARAGLIKNFTGIDSPYERPERADIHLHDEGVPPEQLAQEIISHLMEAGLIKEKSPSLNNAHSSGQG